MTTPPLDLPALRAEIARDEPFASIGVDTVLALLDRVEDQDRRLARADGEVQLLRGTVNHDGAQLAEFTARATLAEEAQANWQAVALSLQARAEAAEKAVAAVREALESKVWQYPTMFHTEVDVIDVSDVLEALDGVPDA